MTSGAKPDTVGVICRRIDEVMDLIRGLKLTIPEAAQIFHKLEEAATQVRYSVDEWRQIPKQDP